MEEQGHTGAPSARVPRGSRRGWGGFQGSGEQRTLGGGFLTVGEEERNWKLLQLLVLLTHFLGWRAH